MCFGTNCGGFRESREPTGKADNIVVVGGERRVASELDVIPGYDVGYKLRFENCVYRDIRIKFVSNGMLLRELARDPKLRHYSAIIIDEAHERTIETDILMGLVKNLVFGPRANNLKVIIASATLDGNKFSKYFFDCTVINVPAILLPVETTYTNEQPDSYLTSALVKLLVKIHLAEPEGDVLIFLPGEDEIHELIQLLDEKIEMLAQEFEMDAQLLPLYDSLSPTLLASLFVERVFAPSPANCRRFIVTTSIAETSITVPGIRYVIDSGFMKQKEYNASTGICFLKIVPISKGQAIQRAGRAGRLRYGRCIRLYTLDFYLGTLPDDVVPEIQRSPIASRVLLLKSLQLMSRNSVFSMFLLLILSTMLSRFLLEAVESGCVYQAASVAGMLLAEGSLFQQQSTNAGSSSLPDGTGYGDHIRLLQIYTDWAKERNRWVWCKHHNLQFFSLYLDKYKTESSYWKHVSVGSLILQFLFVRMIKASNTAVTMLALGT
ncbi:probable pre-mRNA-splicing factor ATP-dependent RNA helicase DEAH4 [Tanacetum coccineum]|uniref:RNA helicase n=1 Tax=Tanacetum coccineum TaxID=301880 RepID=A0ABQ5DQY7_9ASTR